MMHGRDFIFVRKENNLVEDTNENKLKDFVLNYLYELDDIDSITEDMFTIEDYDSYGRITAPMAV